MNCLTVLLLGGVLVQGKTSSTRPKPDNQQSNPPPAVFPQNFEVQVAGQPALKQTVSHAIQGAIHSRFVAAPGATWTNDPFSNGVLPSGASVLVPVHVRVMGADGTPCDGTVVVKVVNTGVKLGNEATLWFDNRPENIVREGTLYTASLESDKPVRLLYHHTCRASEPMVMRAEIRNPSDQDARVLVIPGDARPNREPVIAGAAAAADYLPAWVVGSGEIVDVPPHTSRLIAFRQMVLGDVMSGLCSLQLLGQGPPSLDFVAVAEFRREMLRPWENALLSKTPYNEVGPQPIPVGELPPPKFPSLKYIGPNVTESIDLMVGNHSVMKQIGEEGIPQLGGGRALNGNYGVVYQYSIEAKNTTLFPANVTVDLKVVSPFTSGVFIVDGQLVTVRPATNGKTRNVLTLPLKPKSHRSITVISVPISGGSYPNEMHFQAQLTS